ncbi:MAG: hypothetical protein STHCBS139747_007243 [Sporothrix thermara]
MDDGFVLPPPRPPPLLSPEALHHLCTHGYLGLDLPHHLAAQYDQLLAASDAFFAQPPETKQLYRPGIGLGPQHRGPPTTATNTERGYAHIAGEKEYLTLRKSMTHLPPGIYDAAAPLWHDTAHLLHRILGDIGVYLGLEPTAWDSVVADSLEPGSGVYDNAKGKAKAKETAGETDEARGADRANSGRPNAHPRNDPPTLLRLFRYEPGGGGAEQHRDLGLLTLCVCWGKGLQVRPQPLLQHAIDVNADPSQPLPPPPLPQQQQQKPPSPSLPWLDAPRVTVMTGDTLHILSSYRIPSALHRVVVDPLGETVESHDRPSDSDDQQDTDTPPSESRRSIVFALRSTTAGDIDLAAFGAHGSVGGRELYNSIRKSRVNINTNKETRAAMRAENERARCAGNEAETYAEPGRQATSDNGESMDSDNAIEGELAGVA